MIENEEKQQKQTTTASTDELGGFSDEQKQRLQDADLELNTIEEEKGLLDQVAETLKGAGESVARLKARGEEFVETVEAKIDGVTARASEVGSELGQRTVRFGGRLALCGALLTGAAAGAEATDMGEISDADITTGAQVEQDKCEALADAADIPDDINGFHCTDQGGERVGFDQTELAGYYDGYNQKIYILDFDDQTTRELLHTALHEKKHHLQFDTMNPIALAKWAYSTTALEHEDRPYEQEANQYADEAIKSVDVDKLEDAFVLHRSEIDDGESGEYEQSNDEGRSYDESEGERYDENDSYDEDESYGEAEPGGGAEEITGQAGSDWATVGEGPLNATVEQSNLEPGQQIELDDEYLLLSSPREGQQQARRVYPGSQTPFGVVPVEDGSGTEKYLPIIEKDSVEAVPEIRVEDGTVIAQIRPGSEPIEASWDAISQSEQYGIVMSDDGIAGLYDHESGRMVVDQDWLQ